MASANADFSPAAEADRGGFAEQQLRAFGLLPAEYAHIVARLGRQPNRVELGMLGAMWSEHCGYKHSRKLLKLLPTTGPQVLQGPGENAGAVDIGDGLAVVLKMESHNHPSAVEPFQGAATGVGGILRDIFTMGARPVALLDSLRFGDPAEPRTEYLVGGVIGGIAHYGNCVIGEERLVWRDRTGKVHFDTIGNFVDSRLEGGAATLPLAESDAEVLSVDVRNEGHSSWHPVSRVFKRRASHLVRLKTALGRAVTLTPEHNVLGFDGGWRFLPAAGLAAGDRVALALGLPSDDETWPTPIDLIEVLGATDHLGDGVWVVLPDDWVPTPEVRSRMRDIEPSVHRRHRYLSNRRLPLKHYLELESAVGLPRSQMRLQPRSGKANVVSAVLTFTPRFARLLGYFASEGCVSRNGNTEVVVFVFAKYEEEYVQDAIAGLRELGLKVRLSRRDSTTTVHATSWLLGGLLRDVWGCGASSSAWVLPSFVFAWSRELQFEVLKGLFRADGSLTLKTHGNHAKMSFATSSRRLFEQTLVLLHNRGILPSIHARPASETELEGRQVERLPTYCLEISNVADLEAIRGVFGAERVGDLCTAQGKYADRWQSNPRRTLAGGLALVNVVGVEEVDAGEDGTFVYDIEVDHTHVFATSGGLVVHNCIGVPTVGGEISFDAGYTGNPIVNAMCIGVVSQERLTRAAATGPGNPLLLVGADTGRDGLQGAAFASNEDPEASHRGVVQVGNPFLEKLLLEACLAVLETGDVLAMQDLGAAGLTSSAVEMAARGGLGVEIDVARVPRRELGLDPFEVMLSESQERMLVLVRRGSEDAVRRHFARWELHAERVGMVTDDSLIRVRDGDDVVAELPIPLLTDEVFAYELHAQPPDSVPIGTSLSVGEAPRHETPEAALLRLLGSPNLCSRRFAFRQYDSTVQANTVLGPGHAAAVVRVDGTRKGLALTTDCNPRFMRADPRRGAAQAVAEAARNLACVGAEPIAVTDCLNFGNPEKPGVAWQLTEAIHGLAEACRALDVPIVSGNVSLYNETAGRAIPPTPTVGMVGLLEDVSLAVPTGFTTDMTVIILGAAPSGLGSGEYAGDGEFPRFDLDDELRLGRLLRGLAARRLLRSAQDVADGGLAVALAECAMIGGVGATLDVLDVSDVALFSEDQGRAVVTCASDSVGAILQTAAESGVAVQVAGTTGGNRLTIGAGLNVSLAALRRAWETQV